MKRLKARDYIAVHSLLNGGGIGGTGGAFKMKQVLYLSHRTG